jgi:hypothetical protein
MRKLLTVAFSIALIPAFALAGPPAPKAAGIESKDYQWAKMEGEHKIDHLDIWWWQCGNLG